MRQAEACTAATANNTVALHDLSDLCLIFARAFLPPTWEGAVTAMAGNLPDDVRDGAAACGMDVDGDLQRFDEAMRRIADQTSLLVVYSQMFLSPPIPAPLNAGLYLDGAVNGRSVATMEARYRLHGIERARRFMDLSDHLSVQLEFLAFLLGAAADRIRVGGVAEAESLTDDAASFAGSFICPWLPELAERTARASSMRAQADPYTPLVAILRSVTGIVATLPSPARPAFAPSAG